MHQPGEALDPAMRRGEALVRGKRCRGGVAEDTPRVRCILRLRGAGDAPMQVLRARDSAREREGGREGERERERERLALPHSS